jgi:hypothetical protein
MMLVWLLAVSSCLTAVHGSCEEVDGACICTSAEGTEWDLTDIQSNNIQTTGDTLPGCTLCTGEWTYTFAICGNAAPQTGTGCVSTALRNAFRVDESLSPRCEYMGQDAVAGVPLIVADLDDAEGDGVSITYTDTIRSMTVNLRCATPYATAPEPLEPGSGANIVTLTWYTDAVCLASGGNGWLIVILMSVAAGIYVGGGIGYVKRQNPDAAIALDTHPHIELWRQVPGLVSDGIYFSRVTAASNVGFLGFLAPKDQPGMGGGYSAVDEGGVGGSAEKAPLRIAAETKSAPKPKPKPKPKAAAKESDSEESSGEYSSEEEDGGKGPVE